MTESTTVGAASTPQASREHLSAIARGGSVNLLGAAVSAVSGLALTLVVTNGFDSRDAGVFFTATSMLLVLAGLGNLGTEAGLGRFALGYVESRRSADLPACMRAARRPVLVLSTALTVVVVLGRDQIAARTGLGESGPLVVAIVALTLPALSATLFYLSATRAFGDMGPTVLIDKITRSAAQPLVALGIGAAGGGLIALTVGWAVPYGVAAGLAAWAYQRRATTQVQEVSSPARPYATVRREFWAFTWPRGIAQLSQVAIQRADIIIVAALLGPVAAAVYTAATRFVTLGQFGTQAIQQVLQPRFSLLVARGDLASLKHVFTVSTGWTAAISWPIYVVVACSAGLYLSLFGEEYRTGHAVVIVMALAMMFATASGPVDTLLLMSGRSYLSLFNSLTALVVDIALCFALIPSMGITGAAIAWLVAIVVRVTLALVQVWWTQGIYPLSAGTAVVTVANLVCFGAPLLVLDGLGWLSWWTLVGVGVVGGCAYLLALWWARSVLELAVFRTMLSRGRGRRQELPDD